MYMKERSSRANTLPQRRSPSFSSTLLDAIYRSIDESNGAVEDVLGGPHRETAAMMKKQSSSVPKIRRDTFLQEEKDIYSLGRTVMNEIWMEKHCIRSNTHYNSVSCSSDSSSGSGGMLSSSEAESGRKGHSRRSSRCNPQRTKPVSEKKQPKSMHEGGFSKSKLRALRIYCELKKVKQPISPGGRIASFFNSIFSPRSGKKLKTCPPGTKEDASNFEHKPSSPSSSVTSFSRSCLSKTPTSREKSGNGCTKRTVRFCPVSIIVDENSRPCGHKCIYGNDPGLLPMPQKLVLSKSKGEEVAKGADYQGISYHRQKNTSQLHHSGFRNCIEADQDSNSDDDADDDSDSCLSSDLFELDHLVGIGRYREELPVYETTNLKTNQAIANGFIL